MSEQSTPLEMTPEPEMKKRKGGAQPGVKVSAEVLARRKEGRLKAMATMQSQIEKSGIKRREGSNKLALSNVIPIPLINQKNYYTEYLKKDDQMMMLRDIKEFNFQIKENKAQKQLEKQRLTTSMALDSSTATPDVQPLVSIADDNDEADDDEDEDDVEFTKVGSDIVVIHPGTTNIRVGLATDVYPKSIANLILYPKVKKEPTPDTTDNSETLELSPSRDLAEDADFLLHKKTISANFKERMRYYKRRILPNSSEQCLNFNKRSVAEEIPELNDIHKLEYLNAKQLLTEKRYLIGDEALTLDNYDDWQLRSPFKNGDFNDEGYESTQEVLGDLEIIISSLLEKELQITKKNINNYKLILVIPNLYSKTYVDHMMSLLLKSLNFGRVAIMQEGVLLTFGSGISSACIIDIGSDTTKVSCIDEGMILENSQINLDYGGSDITRLFISLLLQNNFPYSDIDLNDINDWKLANDLKHQYVTFQDADLAIQVYNFMVRKPNKLTQKFELKVFDEVMISAMGLFYPEIFPLLRKQAGAQDEKKKLFPKHRDYFSGEIDDPGSIAQENTCNATPVTLRKDEDCIDYLSELTPGLPPPFRKADEPLSMTPLDILVIESITQCSYLDLAKMKKLYENILIVGGSSKISGFDSILYDRINIWRSRLLSCSNLEDIFKLIELEKAEFYKQKEKEEVFKINSKLYNKIESIINDSPILPVEILSSSREIDPEILCWKGGSVYGRIKVVNEMMVDYKEYDILGLRCFQHKSMFHF